MQGVNIKQKSIKNQSKIQSKFEFHFNYILEANIAPTWSQLGLTWPNLAPTWAQLGSNLVQLGPTWRQLGPNLAPTWPNLPPAWPQLAPTLTNLFPTCSIWAQLCPTCPNLAPTCPQFGPTWLQLGSNLGPTWPQTWPQTMAQLGSSWTHLGLPTLTKGSVQKPPQRSRLKGGGAGDRPVGVLDKYRHRALVARLE